MSLDLVEYSERSIAVFGDTKPYKEDLKAMGGRFNGFLTYNDEKCPGWIFPKNKYDDLVEFIEGEDEKPEPFKMKEKEKKKKSPTKKIPKTKEKKAREIIVSSGQFKSIKKRTVHHIRAPDADYYGSLNPGSKLVFSNDDDMTITRTILSIHKVLNMDKATELYADMIDTDVEGQDDEKDDHPYQVILEF